ncbi:MAG: hypothetical protein GC162_17450 [Planctomycetes bacterium]|nr:hypothetical protein [Planctomycetota bacterium]
MPIDIETLRRYRRSVFIETGTYMGMTVQKALDVGFDRVISIEIDPGMHAQAKAKFAGESRVELLLGDTLAHLPAILASLDQPATFWLDAHRSGPLTGGVVPYPVLGELQLIASHPIKDHAILIDDRRLIPTEWRMNEADVHTAIRRINPSYQISYEPGIVPNDIIAARVA